MTKGIILLSGGLDSLVSLDIAKKDIDIKLALFLITGKGHLMKKNRQHLILLNIIKLSWYSLIYHF